jgi:translation initiation factor eIF-2B subunit epsilon
MALGQVGGSKFVSILGTDPAFRFVLQTLHDQEIVNEDAIFDWAFERKDESKDSPLGRLFWQKPNQDFLEWLEEEDSGSDNDGEDDTDEDSD